MAEAISLSETEEDLGWKREKRHGWDKRRRGPSTPAGAKCAPTCAQDDKFIYAANFRDKTLEARRAVWRGGG